MGFLPFLPYYPSTHIYDADDPNLPLWMKFQRNGGSSRDILYGCGSGGGQGGDLNGLRFHMLNGILVLCSTLSMSYINTSEVEIKGNPSPIKR